MVTTLRRITLTALTFLAALTGVGQHQAMAATTTYRVVGTGDSIVAMSFGFGGPGGRIVTADRWLDLEHGRNAYTVGMAGRASTASIWPLLLSRSQAGGWIIIQDNALGVSDYGWQALMSRISAETPADRCLLAVLPGYRADVNATLAADTARRATIMGQTLMSHSCRAFVYLNRYLRDNPARFPDGQHPDATAQAWIRGQINSIVG